MQKRCRKRAAREKSKKISLSPFIGLVKDEASDVYTTTKKGGGILVCSEEELKRHHLQYW